MTVWMLLVAAVLLLANGFFVAAEFALVGSRRTELERLAEEGDRRARVAVEASRDLSLQLAGAQLGITMASLGLGFVAEPTLGHLLEGVLHDWISLPTGVAQTLGFVIALVVVVFLHMVIGEMVPKNIALAGPEKVLLWLAIPNRLYVVAFRPVIRLLNGVANGATRLLRVEPRDELRMAASAQELAVILADTRRDGLIEDVEHRLLSGALGFRGRPVTSVIVPIERVASIDRAATVADVEAAVVATGHSRLLVEDGDNVVGFVHCKDLLGLPADQRGAMFPLDAVRQMVVVPEGATLEAVLLRMQRTRTHLALVRASDGTEVGVVTLEDVVEAIVGDIRDESDPGARAGA